jgi:hypothetical protein
LWVIESRKHPLQIVDLRQIVEHDVWIGRVQHREVLVIVFRPKEAAQRPELRDDRTREHLRLVELGDIRRGDLLLFIVGRASD